MLYNRSYASHTRVLSPTPDDVQLEGTARDIKLAVAFQNDTRYYEGGQPATDQPNDKYNCQTSF